MASTLDDPRTASWMADAEFGSSRGAIQPIQQLETWGTRTVPNATRAPTSSSGNGFWQPAYSRDPISPVADAMGEALAMGKSVPDPFWANISNLLGGFFFGGTLGVGIGTAISPINVKSPYEIPGKPGGSAGILYEVWLDVFGGDGREDLKTTLHFSAVGPIIINNQLINYGGGCYQYTFTDGQGNTRNFYPWISYNGYVRTVHIIRADGLPEPSQSYAPNNQWNDNSSTQPTTNTTTYNTNYNDYNNLVNNNVTNILTDNITNYINNAPIKTNTETRPPSISNPNKPIIPKNTNTHPEAPNIPNIPNIPEVPFLPSIKPDTFYPPIHRDTDNLKPETKTTETTEPTTTKKPISETTTIYDETCKAIKECSKGLKDKLDEIDKKLDEEEDNKTGEIKSILCQKNDKGENEENKYQYQGLKFERIENQINAIAKVLLDIEDMICSKSDPVVGVPEWWPNRVGADRPQLIVYFALLENNKINTKSIWHTTIPHFNPDKKTMLFKQPPLIYIRGNTEIRYTLTDNSKFIMNCQNDNECRKVWEYWKTFINPKLLETGIKDGKIGVRTGDIELNKVVAIYADFYSKGQKSKNSMLNPDWRAYWNDN